MKKIVLISLFLIINIFTCGFNISKIEPYVLKSNSNVACLLIHGLGANPLELKYLAKFLNENNFNINAILLPGHGSVPEALKDITWNQLYNEVKLNYKEMIKNYSKVYVIGFSTGGTLALHLAYEFNIDKIVLINPFIYLKYNWYYILPLEVYINTIGHLIPYVKSDKININSPEHKKERSSYDTIYLSTVRSVLELIEKVKIELKNIKSPVLITQSKYDEVVAPQGAIYIYENIGSKDKILKFYYNSNHIITLDYDKDLLFKDILEFLNN